MPRSVGQSVSQDSGAGAGTGEERGGGRREGERMLREEREAGSG